MVLICLILRFFFLSFRFLTERTCFEIINVVVDNILLNENGMGDGVIYFSPMIT